MTTIVALKKKTRREREAVVTFPPFACTGWKPLVWWLLSVGAGFGERRITRRYKYATLDEARAEGEKMLGQGMTWAWVEERPTRKGRGLGQ